MVSYRGENHLIMASRTLQYTCSTLIAYGIGAFYQTCLTARDSLEFHYFAAEALWIITFIGGRKCQEDEKRIETFAENIAKINVV